MKHVQQCGMLGARSIKKRKLSQGFYEKLVDKFNELDPAVDKDLERKEINGLRTKTKQV
jgi:hypothetical protein